MYIYIKEFLLKWLKDKSGNMGFLYHYTNELLVEEIMAGGNCIGEKMYSAPRKNMVLRMLRETGSVPLSHNQFWFVSQKCERP